MSTDTDISAVRYSLEELSNCIDSGQPLPQWELSIPRIQCIRSHVMHLVKSGGRAYGFTSLLGHLDKYKSQKAFELDKLDAHLVGDTKEVSVRTTKAITAIKLCHLSQGLSGISSNSYVSLIERFPHLGLSHNDFLASYGAGDVVPATWWAQSVVDKSALEPGDTIALVNGQFIATGVALSYYNQWVEFIEYGCQLVIQASKLFIPDRVQTTVAMRDPGALHKESLRAIDSLGIAISNNASRSSNNPLFYPRDNKDLSQGVYAVSNASFLDFELSSALLGLINFLSLLSAYMRGATAWLCKNISEREGEVIHGAYFVQPPKISKSYYDKVLTLANCSGNPAQSESMFIEDVCDNALRRAITVEEIIGLVKFQAKLLEKSLNCAYDRPGERPQFYDL